MTDSNPLGQADLHMHTTASDGKPDVRTLLQFVSQHRPELDVIAITDHDTLDASLWAYEHRHHYPFDIVPGVEVSSRDGHILALWVTTPIPPHMPLRDTVQAIHEAGGMAVLAHPFHLFMWEHLKAASRHWKHPMVLKYMGIDAIETHNAGIFGWGCNWLARRLARKINVSAVSGSDAHTLGAIGSGRTYFKGRTAADLRRALVQLSTIAGGTPWPTKDYVAYFKHERQRKAMISSGAINSSPLTNQ